jgi:DNA-binding transcriptional regulator YiaG
VLLIDGDSRIWYNCGMRNKQKIIVPTTGEALNRAMRLPDDIRLITEKNKMSKCCLARSLGVHRNRLDDWAKGIVYPDNPIIFMSISLWADRLRKSG